MLIGQDAFDRPALMPALRRALMGNTGAHSAVEMALLDLTGRAGNTRLVDAVAPKPLRTQVKPMWLLGNAHARAGHRRGARQGSARASTSSSSRSA